MRHARKANGKGRIKAKSPSKTSARSVDGGGDAGLGSGAGFFGYYFWTSTSLGRGMFNAYIFIAALFEALRYMVPYWGRRVLWAVMCLVAVIWVGAWLWLSGAVDRAVKNSQTWFIDQSVQAGLVIKDVLVKGRHYQSSQSVLQASTLQVGAPILQVDPHMVQQQIESLPWIYAARVEIHYPQTVFIDLVERNPMALWLDNGRLRLVDKYGVVLTDDVDAYKHLPIVIGQDAPAAAYDILSLLKAEPEILSRVKAAALIGQRRWDLKLKNDVIIHLPERDIGLSLRRLVRAQEQNKVMDKKIISVDVRYDDRLIIKTQPGAVQTIRSSGI